MSDEDEQRGFRAHLVNRARQQQAAQQQQAPARAHDINRTSHFDGSAAYTRWLAAAWSIDGSQVAAGGRNVDGKHGELEIWDGRTGRHEGHSTRHLRHDLAGPVISLSWSPDSAHLASLEGDIKSGHRVLHIRSQAEGKRAISLPAGAEMTQVAWSPDGSQLALSARDSRSVLLIDPASGQLRRTLEGVSGPVAWEPGGHRLAGPDWAKIAIFDAASGQRERTIPGQKYAATALAWATRGKVLAASDGENIRVLDADSDDSSVHSMGWLDRGRYLLEFRKYGAMSRSDANTMVGTVTLWDVTTRSLFWFMFHEPIAHVQRPPAEVLVAPPGGRQALFLFDEKTPGVWEISGDLPGFEP